MKNSMSTREAINRTYKKLMAMPKKELRALINKHKNGDIARALIELDKFSKSKYYAEAIIKATRR